VVQVGGFGAWDRWNEREAAAVGRRLPATAPSPALTLLSTAAEGGGLWVAVGAALAWRVGAENPDTSRHLHVLVYETAESIR
jgi:hypothetical protein